MGILGGAFNPPHLGHLVLAEEAAHQLGLNRVLLLPTGRSAHKEITDDPGGETRAALVEAAVGGSEGLAVERCEVEAAASSDRPSYTHLTLEALRGREPGAELIVLLGADAAAGLASWGDPARVVELAGLGVAMRPGAARAEVEAAVSGLDGEVRMEWVEIPQLEISSTEVRRRVASGRPYRRLVGAAVAEVIEAKGLYR